METIQKMEGNLILPKHLLKRTGISRDVVIVVEKNEIRIRASQKTVTKKMVGLARDMKPEMSSVDLVKELRSEWKID